MDNLLDLERCRAFIHCQIKPEDGKGGTVASAPKQFAVTISRQTGVGAHAVAECLATWLDERLPMKGRPWTVFDRNLVEQVLEDHHLPTKLAQFMTEARRSAIEDMVEELLGLHPSSWTLAQQTSETVLKLAELGRVILVGRGANRVAARLGHVFHVRLIAPKERRVEHVREQLRMSTREARAFVEREDRSKSRYVKRVFRSDIEDATGYHLVMNTADFDARSAAEAIGGAMAAWARLPQGPAPKH